MTSTTSRTEWITGSIIIVVVTGGSMAIYSTAQGVDSVLDGVIGGLFALVGILAWLAISRLRQ